MAVCSSNSTLKFEDGRGGGRGGVGTVGSKILSSVEPTNFDLIWEELLKTKGVVIQRDGVFIKFNIEI